MSERLFEGDFPKWRGLESYILTSGAQFVAIQSLASLREDSQQSLLRDVFRSPKQGPPRSQPIFDKTPKSFDADTDGEEQHEVPLKWRIRGMRGENTSQVEVSKVNSVIGTHEGAGHTHADSEEERKRKGKGKLVKAHLKEKKKKYGTRSVTQKVLGSAMAGNVAQTDRIRHQKEEGVLPKEPITDLIFVDDSETKSVDITKYVVKRRKEKEEERLISKGI